MSKLISGGAMVVAAPPPPTVLVIYLNYNFTNKGYDILIHFRVFTNTKEIQSEISRVLIAPSWLHVFIIRAMNRSSRYFRFLEL